MASAYDFFLTTQKPRTPPPQKNLKESSHVVSNLDKSSGNFSKSHFKNINQNTQNFKT